MKNIKTNIPIWVNFIRKFQNSSRFAVGSIDLIICQISSSAGKWNMGRSIFPIIIYLWRKHTIVYLWLVGSWEWLTQQYMTLLRTVVYPGPLGNLAPCQVFFGVPPILWRHTPWSIVNKPWPYAKGQQTLAHCQV